MSRSLYHCPKGIGEMTIRQLQDAINTRVAEIMLRDELDELNHSIDSGLYFLREELRRRETPNA